MGSLVFIWSGMGREGKVKSRMDRALEDRNRVLGSVDDS